MDNDDRDTVPRRKTARWRHRVERAASLVEYALLVALIAVACIVAVDRLGVAGSDSLNDSGSRISVAGP